MNSKHLREVGVPEESMPAAIEAVRDAAASGHFKGKLLRDRLREVVENPDAFTGVPFFARLAVSILESRKLPQFASAEYRTWGTDLDPASHAQMREACRIPSAVGGALMPDAHVGYGLPIGGVLATIGTVVPYAVGVDIACRMRLSILDMPVSQITDKPARFRDSLTRGTYFGVGVERKKRIDHPVLAEDWTITRITRESKDKAARQIGTSGSGNHFVEFGIVTIDTDSSELNLPAGEYCSLLSHSGSRGPGAAVCSTYSAIAQQRLPKKYTTLGRLAWLDLASEAGKEYWEAMNLMGAYAAANHEVIHQEVIKLLGARVVAKVENHHNFAWKEEHQGQEVIVHRKGATPAGMGVLGVIPGSMASPAYIVKGKGVPESYDSASHGAGRRMSRTQARNKYNFRAVQKDLEKKGVEVIEAGSDEVPGVYKDIESVMAAQTDLVDVVARFDPKIVRMCGDGSKAED